MRAGSRQFCAKNKCSEGSLFSIPSEHLFSGQNGANLEPSGPNFSNFSGLLCHTLQLVDIPLDNLLDHSQPLAEVDGIPGSQHFLAVHLACAHGDLADHTIVPATGPISSDFGITRFKHGFPKYEEIAQLGIQEFVPALEVADHGCPMSSPEEIELTGDHDFVTVASNDMSHAETPDH